MWWLWWGLWVWMDLEVERWGRDGLEGFLDLRVAIVSGVTELR